MNCKKISLLLLLFFAQKTFAQTCDCEKEFSYVKDFMETNYVGFKDKLKQMTPAVYNKNVVAFQKLSTAKNSKEKCLLIIASYLQIFRDLHVSISSQFDGTVYDTAYIASREKIDLSSSKIASLKTSRGIEGIYYYKYDSSYKVAVVKSRTALRDYVGIMLESKNVIWKKGMVKFEFKKQPNGDFRGVLYMRNHMPKTDWFSAENNILGNDWQREGAANNVADISNTSSVVASKKISDKTLYLKISSFESSNGKIIDSMIKANKQLLDETPNLIIDLRNNGGGADFTYEPLLSYIYTNPVKTIGIDVLSTDTTIATWERILDNNDIPAATKANLQKRIDIMKQHKGSFVNVFDDNIDSSYTFRPFPKKIVVLINENCASTTEQFLLAAKQSKKIILAGNHSEGVLDYANVRSSEFSCMPYSLNFSSSRSRRIDIGQGIDNVGIKPDVYFAKGKDWIEEARKLLEK